MVKLGSAIVFVIPPVFYLLYARKKYGIDKKVPANTKLIAQRCCNMCSHFRIYSMVVASC